MTTSERLVNDLDSVASPEVFLFVAARAGIGQAMERPKEWRGAEGFGWRLADDYSRHFIAQVLQRGPDHLLHYDNRYFASGKQGFAPRLGYALSSTLLARRTDGSRTVAYTAIGGAAGAAFISRAWQPRSTTSAGDAAVSFGIMMGVRAAINVAREFTPRLRGILFP
jgi:hypothetical protein